MSKLILQTINKEDLNSAIELLKSKKILSSRWRCKICGTKIDKEKIGGFIPKNKLVYPVCDDIKCITEATYKIMEFNGNGSPIIEND